MQPIKNKTDIEELGRLLSPMISLEGVDPSLVTLYGDFLEGISLPSVEGMAKTAVPKEIVEPLRMDTLSWIRIVIKPEWLIDGLEKHLLAAYNAVRGCDAFIGAWTKEGRTFQVVVTKTKLHLLVNMIPPQRQADDVQKMQSALQLAEQLLQLPTELHFEDWKVANLGKTILLIFVESVMNRMQPDTAIWYKSLTIVTDGSSVKYSVIKNKHERGPRKKNGERYMRMRWFPRDDK